MLIAGADRSVRDRWRQGLVQFPRVIEAEDLGAFQGFLERGVVLSVVHLGLPGLNGLPGICTIRERYPKVYLFVLSDRPQEDEGIALLRSGVRGYGNTYMDPRLMAKAMALVEAGEIWVGRRLMIRLIKGAAQSNRRHEPHIARDNNHLSTLTEREQQVALMVGQGTSNRNIAADLGIAERTVKNHISSIFTKTGVADRLQLALLVNGVDTSDVRR